MVALIDNNSKKQIEQAIKEAELLTSGEIRVHIKAKCDDDVYGEAKKIFQKLNMHRTKNRNGVFIFIGLKSRRFALLGDIGIHKTAGNDFWNEVRSAMEDKFQKGKFTEGIIDGVMTIGEKLKRDFPRNKNDVNELPNTISVDN